MSQTRVEVFKGSVNEVGNLINQWAERRRVRILNTSLCYDEGKSGLGQVFVIVVYESLDQPAT